jgi:hypothetical protein
MGIKGGYVAREANRAFLQFADRDGRLTGSEVRFALNERQWQRGRIGGNRDYRWIRGLDTTTGELAVLTR